MRYVAIALIGWALSEVASAADHPLESAKLMLKRSASGTETLQFVVRDPGFPFPAIGSSDDPSGGGAVLELVSAAEPGGVTFVVPAGVGTPGWRAKDGTRDAYTYRNPGAVPGPGAVKSITLKQGRVIKAVARDTGLALTGPQGIVGVRLTTGSLRNCVRFDATTITKDVAGAFVASTTSGSALVDCESLLPEPPTTSTTSSTTTTTVLPPCSSGEPPTCGGACPAGETCRPGFEVGSGEQCRCFPDGVETCGATGYPTCGGACGDGGRCIAFAIGTPSNGGCICVEEGAQCGSFSPLPGGPENCVLGYCSPGRTCMFDPAVGFCLCRSVP